MTIEGDTKQFDATPYLLKLKVRGKERDYLPVAYRLLWLRTEHPEAAIETDLVRLDDGYAVFKARVSIPNGGSATGWGSETVGDFPDYLEKGETKALGRALAALGYGTQFTDLDEGTEPSGEKNVVDAPVQRPAQGQAAQGKAPAPAASRSNPAVAAKTGHQEQPSKGQYASTESQRKAIFAKARQAGMSTEDLRARIQMVYKLDSTKDLTLEQASDLLQYLDRRGHEDMAETTSEMPDGQQDGKLDTDEDLGRPFI